MLSLVVCGCSCGRRLRVNDLERVSQGFVIATEIKRKTFEKKNEIKRIKGFLIEKWNCVVERCGACLCLNRRLYPPIFIHAGTMWKSMVLVVTFLMVTLCLTPTVIEADEGATLETGPDVAINGGADIDLGKFAEGSRTDDETIAKVGILDILKARS